MRWERTDSGDLTADIRGWFFRVGISDRRAMLLMNGIVIGFFADAERATDAADNIIRAAGRYPLRSGSARTAPR